MRKSRELYYRKVLFPLARKLDGNKSEDHRRRVAVFFEHEKSHAAGPEAFPQCHRCLDDLMTRKGLPKGGDYQMMFEFKQKLAKDLVRMDYSTGLPQVDQPELAEFLLNGVKPAGR